MISSGRYPYMLSAPAFQDSITPSRVFRKIASCDDSTIAARSPVSACLASSVFDMGRSFPRRSGLVPPGAYVWLTSRFTGAGGRRMAFGLGHSCSRLGGSGGPGSCAREASGLGRRWARREDGRRAGGGARGEDPELLLHQVAGDGEGSGLRRLLDEVIGHQMWRRARLEVQDFGGERDTLVGKERAEVRAAGRAHPEVERAVLGPGAIHMEMARDHERHVSRHALRHAVVVDRHDVDGLGRALDVRLHEWVDGEDARLEHAVGEALDRGGLDRVAHAVETKAVELGRRPVQHDRVRELLQGLLERPAVVVAADPDVRPAHRGDVIQDNVLGRRAERRGVTCIDDEVHVEAAGDLLGELQPERGQMDVGDVEHPDLAGLAHRARLNGGVDLDRAVDDPLELGPELVELRRRGADRRDDVGRERERARERGRSECGASKRCQREDLGRSHQHHGDQDGGDDRDPPRAKGQRAEDQGSEPGHRDGPESVHGECMHGVGLDPGDETVDPAGRKVPRELVDPHVEQGGAQPQRSRVGVGGQVPERGKHDIRDAPPELRVQPDHEWAHVDPRGPPHGHAEPRTGQPHHQWDGRTEAPSHVGGALRLEDPSQRSDRSHPGSIGDARIRLYLRGLLQSVAVQASTNRNAAIAGSIASVVLVAIVASVPRSPFQPVLPGSAGPSGPLRWLAELTALDSVHGSALVVVSVLTVTLAAAAFLAVLREAWQGTVSPRTVIGLAVAYHVAVLFLPLLFSRDVYSYAFYGRIAAVYHANPYVATPSDFPSDPLAQYVGPRWVGTPAVYGPLFTLLSSGVARLFGSVAATIAAFRFIAIAASLATIAVLAPLVRRVRPDREAFAVAMIGLNPVVLFQSVASGHND